MAMAYILLLNPLILGGKDVAGNVLSQPALITATVVAAAVTTLLMGFVGKVPLALAAGLSVSGVISTQVAPNMTWPQAMGMCVMYGVVIMLLVVTGLREMIMNAIPLALKHAITMGIGTFIALIGLVKAGFVHASEGGGPVTLGPAGELAGWPVLIFAVTLLLIFMLQAREVPGAILIGIVVGTIVAAVLNAAGVIGARAWAGGPPELAGGAVSMPDFSLFGDVEFGGWGEVGAMTVGMIVFTLVLAGFFDAMATIIGVGTEAGLADDKGRMPGLSKALFIDGAGGVVGGVAGGSGQTVFVESATGVGGGPYRLRLRRHRPLLRRVPVLQPDHPDRPRRGRGGGPGGHRRDDDAERQARGLERPRRRRTGLPDRRDHAVHLPDHRRSRRRRHLLRRHQGRPGQGPGDRRLHVGADRDLPRLLRAPPDRGLARRELTLPGPPGADAPRRCAHPILREPEEADMLDIADELNRWVEQGRDFAVATVVAVGGSAPRQPGAALAVDSEGSAIGSVSGGCVEGAVYDLCRQSLDDGETVLQTFGYSDEDAFAVGLTCGGVIDILVTPVRADSPGRDVFAAALSAAAGGEAAAVARVTEGPRNCAAEPSSYAPGERTRGRWAATRRWTARRRTRPAPCWTRDTPAPSRSARTARAADGP